MKRPTPHLWDLSQAVMACELKAHQTSGTPALAAFYACEKLRPLLATLMGHTGFRALLARALAMASTEVAWLRAVHVKSDGALEGLDELQAQVDHEQFNEGSILLVAQLLGLLMAFIGESLTLRLVEQTWPKLPRDPGLDKGDTK